MKLFPVLFVILLCGCASEDQDRDRLIKPKHEDLATGQPTLRWDPDYRTNVTYDVVVYEVVKMNASWVPGRQVTYVEGLTATFYKFPEPLAPGDYCWSVRARRGDHVEHWRLQDRTHLYGTVLVSVQNQYARFRIPKE